MSKDASAELQCGRLDNRLASHQTRTGTTKRKPRRRPRKVTALETLHCDAGWRNYHFLKLGTADGIVGWSEFDEGFGSPGGSAVIARLADRGFGPGGRA